MARMRSQEPTWVYRLMCADSCLLYVGIASDVQRRLRQHASTKPWWGNVKVVLSDLYATRPQALRVESHYITHLKPKYNIAGQLPVPDLPHPLLRERDMVEVDGRLYDIAETKRRLGIS